MFGEKNIDRQSVCPQECAGALGKAVGAIFHPEASVGLLVGIYPHYVVTVEGGPNTLRYVAVEYFQPVDIEILPTVGEVFDTESEEATIAGIACQRGGALFPGVGKAAPQGVHDDKAVGVVLVPHDTHLDHQVFGGGGTFHFHPQKQVTNVGNVHIGEDGYGRPVEVDVETQHPAVGRRAIGGHILTGVVALVVETGPPGWENGIAGAIGGKLFAIGQGL